MALTKSQKVFKRAIMLRKKTGMSLKAAFKAAKRGGADGEPPASSVADALKEAATKLPDDMPKMSAPGGSSMGAEEKKPEMKEGGRRRTKKGRGKMGARRTRRKY
jgi:hypothetical protein